MAVADAAGAPYDPLAQLLCRGLGPRVVCSVGEVTSKCSAYPLADVRILAWTCWSASGRIVSARPLKRSIAARNAGPSGHSGGATQSIEMSLAEGGGGSGSADADGAAGDSITATMIGSTYAMIARLATVGARGGDGQAKVSENLFRSSAYTPRMAKKAGIAITIFTLFHLLSLLGVLVGGAVLFSDYRYEQHMTANGVEVEATVLERTSSETQNQLIVDVAPTVPGGSRRVVATTEQEWLHADAGDLLWVTVDPEPPHEIHRGKRAGLSFFGDSAGWLFLIFGPVFGSVLMQVILRLADRL